MFCSEIKVVPKHVPQKQHSKYLRIKLEIGGTYKVEHKVPHYIPYEQMDKYLAKKEEKKDMVKNFVVQAREHSVSMHIPNHIPVSQTLLYLHKQKEREKNDLHEQNLNVQNT